MLGWDREQLRPADGTVAAVRLTVPVKPLREVAVIVDVAEAPVFVETVVGLVAMLKSATLTVTVAEWEREPLAAVMVTEKEPTLRPLQASTAFVEMPAVIMAGLSEQVGPPLGVTDWVRLTVPVRPLMAVTVIVDAPVEPAFKVMLVGLAVTLKSTMFALRETVWASEPLFPVMITV